MNGALGIAWAADIGLLSWRAFSRHSRPPLPTEIASTMVVFGTLGLAGGSAATPAALLGWGLVVASFLNLFTLPGTDTLNTTAAAKAKANQPQTIAGAVKGTP